MLEVFIREIKNLSSWQECRFNPLTHVFFIFYFFFEKNKGERERERKKKGKRKRKKREREKERKREREKEERRKKKEIDDGKHSQTMISSTQVSFDVIQKYK